jgi:thioredoxin-dependent peroxiredoxin
MLQIGDRAPDFSLPDEEMQLHDLSHYLRSNLLLYFYPKDDTPGCTLQATEFSELSEEFEAAGTRVVGVSQDDCFSHQAFRDSYGLKIPLLSDMDGEVCERYGVLQEREKDGVKRVGIQRTTFVIDGQGVVRFARYGVSPGHHAGEMLEWVRGLK